MCAKATILRDSTVSGLESRGGVTQSPREGHAEHASARLGDVATEGNVVVVGPVQRLSSLVFPSCHGQRCIANFI